MDRILFGDNQFFGVNHMSEEKARAQAMRFKDAASIIEVLDVAHDLGIKTFMCTTHDRIGEVCDHMRANPSRYADFEFYPCMPYAHKYANAVAEVGIFETLKRFTPEGGMISTLFKGAVSAVTGDIYELMKMLVDAEMKRFAGLTTRVVFLQNVVTDLLLGFGLDEMFLAFSKHVQQKYGAEAGFITMNLPKMLAVCEKVGIEDPIICANINKIGFRMCGGLEVYERTIREKKFRPIAMSVFASGAVEPETAIEYVCKQPNIRSIVFGASTKSHIKHTKELIERMSA